MSLSAFTPAWHTRKQHETKKEHCERGQMGRGKGDVPRPGVPVPR